MRQVFSGQSTKTWQQCRPWEPPKEWSKLIWFSRDVFQSMLSTCGLPKLDQDAQENPFGTMGSPKALMLVCLFVWNRNP
uniref:Uncharacterized protein n=1 Tax=Brassica oleracea TaxID=3712 RepID=A0A3P6EK38_BRAOL|nr:unnamed protein product [Brassica oleracea]